MQEIFKKYKERLINLSARNSSLVMKKIYKKNSFDLFTLKKFKDNIDEDILNYILKRNKGKIKLTIDPYNWQNEQMEKLKNNINQELKQAIEKLSTIKDKEKYHEEKKNIETKYQEKLQKEQEKIEDLAKTIIDYSSSLNYLNKEILSTEKETGRYEMYVGYPFVEGYFKDKTFVRAPLLLFPVKLNKIGDEWFLENILEQNVMINKVFLLAFSKINGISLNEEIEIEFEELSELEFDDINKIIKYLANIGIEIKNIQETSVQKFVETKRDTIIDYSLGEIVLKPYLILGRFPVANSIYEDYLRLEKTDEENELIKKLLVNKDEKEEYDGTNIFNDEVEQIKEEDFYFLTELDFSQEKAVKMTDSTNQLVIYGPPGTGKSQTIASIISDALIKDKKVLMVSEKRAALDVIYNRLSKINSKVVLLHDSNKDKKEFYEKVKSALESLENKEINTLKDIKNYSKYIDNNISKLEEIGEFLHKEREFGLTLQKMYSMSKKIVSKEDRRYEIFKKFRECSFVDKYNYEDVKLSVEKILKKDVIEDYYKYKKYITNNSIILRMREGIDYFDIDDYIKKLNKILDEYKSNDISRKGFIF